MSDLSVLLTMLTHKPVDVGTMMSMVGTSRLLAANDIEFGSFVLDSTYIDRGRNRLAHELLRTNTFNRYFSVDSDMVWNPQSFMRLIELSRVYEIVGATYVYQRDDINLFTVMGAQNGRVPVFRYNEHGCLTFDGMSLGFGFCCIQRKVLEELAKESPTMADIDGLMPRIFYTSYESSDRAKSLGADCEFCGEDRNFFRDVREKLGYEVWLDPSVQLGHVGSKVYTADVKHALGKPGAVS